MSWCIDNHPKGGLQITHLAVPRFTARWTTGEFPIDQVREGGFFWTDEGSSEEDPVHLYEFLWEEAAPKSDELKELMLLSLQVIEEYIFQ